MTRLERRALLGALGTGALGTTLGCLDVLASDEPRRRFEPDELDPILSADAPDVVRPAPVQPSEGAVDESVARLDELLDAVPEPLTADDVPNGTVRTDIDRTREIAANRRDLLSNEPDRFHTLRSSLAARHYAGEAAVTFEAVADDRSGDDIETERDEFATRLERRRTAIDYRGTDPQRTLLLGYHLESELSAASRWLENRAPEEATGVLSIGEIGGAIERTRGALAFADDLERRHEARFDDGRSRSFAPRFEDALARSLDAIDAAEIPDPDRSPEPSDLVESDVSETVAERVILEVGAPFVNGAERTREAASAGETATALRTACAFERDRRAFETIRERIDDGQHRTIETIDDVREARESALEAAATASTVVSPAEPSPGGDLLAREYEQLGRVDGRIRDADRRTNLWREYADYVAIAAQCEALPAAVAAIEERLSSE